jgi:hypothetical protein
MAGRSKTRIVGYVLGISLLMGLCPACNKRQALYPVTGKVFVDGQPADGAQVVLHPVNDAGPQSLRPSAKVGPDGTFTLNTFNAETRVATPGAPAGEYVVTVTWLPPNLREILDKQQDAHLPDKLQGRYAQAGSSPLPRAVVQEGPTELPPIELKAGR